MTNSTTTTNKAAKEKRWLAAYTRMHHEKKTHDRLTAMSIESFLPLQIEERQWSDRKKKIERVLIPMMIFVHVDAVDQRRVLELPAILRYMVLRGEHVPAEIPNSQMDRFRFMVNYSDSDVSFNVCDLQPGEHVRVTKGPLQGLEGELITINGQSNIAIRIDMLGCATIEISASRVEAV